MTAAEPVTLAVSVTTIEPAPDATADIFGPSHVRFHTRTIGHLDLPAGVVLHRFDVCLGSDRLVSVPLSSLDWYAGDEDDEDGEDEASRTEVIRALGDRA